MEAIFVQGMNSLAVDYTPGSDVDAGVVVVQNDLVGVTKRSILSDELGALTIEGVFDFLKATGGGSAIAVGKPVYWDDTANVATETVATNKLIGKTVKAATDSDTTVRVKMDQ